ncbi:MAG: hypothetical protein LBH43_16015 [Treponema sp.]|jgi:hypothetical protein|nr:hypothetical protein [Treponema sp.]
MPGLYTVKEKTRKMRAKLKVTALAENAPGKPLKDLCVFESRFTLTR